jgi:hypothetical protein
MGPIQPPNGCEHSLWLVLTTFNYTVVTLFLDLQSGERVKYDDIELLCKIV